MRVPTIIYGAVILIALSSACSKSGDRAASTAGQEETDKRGQDVTKPVDHGETKKSGTQPLPAASDAELVKRGEYLVTIMSCHDCHSPKRMGAKGPEADPELLLSGHPTALKVPKVNKSELKTWLLFDPGLTVAIGPWGISFAANITADEDTGIGKWSEAQFERAVRGGWFKGTEGGRKLLPPMPWPHFSHLTDEDVKALYLYLKTTKPIKNVVPSAIAPDAIP